MPTKPASAKHLRASQRRRLRNKPVRSRARTTVRDAVEAIEEGAWDEAAGLVKEAAAALDRAALRGVIHPNNAARRKSRLLRRYHTARSPDRPQRPPQRPPAPVAVPEAVP